MAPFSNRRRHSGAAFAGLSRLLGRIATPLCAADTVLAALPPADIIAGLAPFRVAVGVSLAAWAGLVATALLGLG
jgi:hypothetical protein